MGVIIEVECESIEVREGRLPKKSSERVKASIEKKTIYLCDCKWKIKYSDIIQTDIRQNEITIESKRFVATIHGPSNNRSSANNVQAWERFKTKLGNIAKEVLPKEKFSTFIQSTSPSSKRKSGPWARGVFGRQASSISKRSVRNTMPWDNRNHVSGVASAEKKHKPVMEEKFDFTDDEEEENDNSPENEAGDDNPENAAGDDNLEFEEVDSTSTPQPLSHKDEKSKVMTSNKQKQSDKKDETGPRKRQRLSKMKKKYANGNINDDDSDESDDDNLFETKITTPAASRLVTPLEPSKTDNTKDESTSGDKDESSVSTVQVEDTEPPKSQPRINTFFAAKKTSKPQSFMPQNNTVPVNTPYRNSTQRPVLSPKRIETTNKKNSWLNSGRHDLQGSETEKRRERLFGKDNLSPKQSREQDRNEDDDPIEDYKSSPKTTARKPVRPQLSFSRQHMSTCKLYNSDRKHLKTPRRLNMSETKEFEVQEPEIDKPRPRGLRNMGNTCYMNATLQMLYSNPSFMESLAGLSNKGPLTDSVVQVFRELQMTDKRWAVTPKKIKATIDEKTDKFRGYEQRDAHEFMSDLIDIINDELKQDETSNIKSFPVYDFCWKIQACLKCNSCGYTRNKEEMYRHISIDVVSDGISDQPGSTIPVTKATVEKGLEQFFQPEIREIKCEKCDEGTHAEQQLRIISKPKLLLLHLKRFIFVERPITPPKEGQENQSPNTSDKPTPAPQVEYVFQKNKTPVQVSEHLSLEAFLANKKDAEKPTSNDLVQDYSLKSIIHHHGPSASSGHYTADAIRRVKKEKQPKEDVEDKVSTDQTEKDEMEDVWFAFDDSITGRKKLEKIISDKRNQETAYMLLYSLAEENDAKSANITTSSAN